MDIKNILVVENDTNWIQYMKNNFLETSIKFEFSSNMIEAMKLISSGSAYYHYVLINYSCLNQNVSLEELINTIKENAPFLKIIFVLNNNNPYQIKEILNSDVKKYLIKPFSFDSLLTELSIQINRNNVNNDFYKNKDIMIDGISDLGNPNSINNNAFNTNIGRDNNMTFNKNNNNIQNPNMGGNPNNGYNPNMGGNSNNGGFNPNMGGNPNNGGFNPNMNGNPNNGGFNPNMGGNPNNGGFNPNMSGNPNNGQGVVRIPKNTTIAIHCPKGGVGKSSISKELAVVYALSKVNGQNLKVCLIDMDVDYGDIAVMLEMKPNKSISDWARAIRSRQSENMETDLLFSFDEMKRFYLLEHKSGLFVLAAPTNLRDAALINEEMVTVIVENLKKEFDVVIIDTGNNVKDFTITSMELADRVLMIGNTDIATVNELLTLKKTLEQIQFPMNKVQLLMNEIKQSDETQAKEIASYLGLPIIGKLPRVSSIEKSNNNGEALSMSEQDNNFTMELKRVANTILPVIKKPNIQGKKGPRKKEKTSIFKKLFGK